jgi:2-polyprenyl-6-methoxyphenol hydroxylase-like FAD-dependent oxidoreductase
VFAQVTVVERDRLAETPDDRQGVPQGRHAHGLLPAGAHILGQLFPGLLDELAAGGVPVVRDPAEMHFAPGGRRLCPDGGFSAPAASYQPSRPYLEAHVRARLRARPNVELRDGCKAAGLDSTAGRVTGARLAARTGESRLLGADLVVDATGRGGRATGWLAEMGFAPPDQERLEVDIRYVSRHLRLAPGALGPEKVVIVGAQPGRPTGVNFLQQEGDRWILTLIGYRGHHPPTDPNGFLEFARGVVPPRAYAAIREAQPLDDPVTHRYRASVRRRYERLDRFPAGLIVFGDALCSFNPVYGQGMSTAALQAVALQECVAAGLEDLGPRFFATATRRIEVAWQMAVGGDLALPEVRARRPVATRVANAYIKRVLAAAEHDGALAERFMKVSSLLAPPTTLLHPAAVRRVIAARRRGPAPEGAAADGRIAVPEVS